jgi:UrcA family protein
MPSNLRLACLPLLGLVTAIPAPAQPMQSGGQEAPIVIVRRIAPSPDVLVRTVSVADLDLRSAVGQQEMEKRVGKAVEDMCVIVAPLPSYKGPMEKPCRDEAWASARPQMDLLTRSAGGAK